MSRLVRTTKIGVKVSKPVYGNMKFRAHFPQETAEPALIDPAAHAKFVDNLFSIRSKTRSPISKRHGRAPLKVAAFVD